MKTLTSLTLTEKVTEKESDAEEYATSGPFARIFNNSIARLLDQALIVGSIEQTIPMLADSTNLSYKTAEKAVEHLESVGFIKAGRRIGNSQTYIFNVEGDLREFIACASRFQMEKKAP